MEFRQNDLVPGTHGTYVNQNLCRSLRNYVFRFEQKGLLLYLIKRNIPRGEPRRRIVASSTIIFRVFVGHSESYDVHTYHIYPEINFSIFLLLLCCCCCCCCAAAAALKDLQSPGQFLGFFKLNVHHRTPPPPPAPTSTSHFHHQKPSSISRNTQSIVHTTTTNSNKTGGEAIYTRGGEEDN